jgi:hypothetical protein
MGQPEQQAIQGSQRADDEKPSRNYNVRSDRPPREERPKRDFGDDRRNDFGMERRGDRDNNRGDRRENKGKRYDNREPREQRPKREKFEFDPDTNFRKYYLNDPQFYEVIIKKEEPPYDFKIHLFLEPLNPDDDKRESRDHMDNLRGKVNHKL